MFNALFALGVFSLLLVLFWVSVMAGRKFGRRQLILSPEHKLETVNVAEGAVFALLGLLIAFTFAGAYDRFELRKTHIIDEANAFKTAYQRIDLLVANKQGVLREDFRQYLDFHLALYHDAPHLKEVEHDYTEDEQLENKIWKEVVEASEKTPNPSIAQLVIPAVNNMFEMTNSGVCMMLIHAPMAIMFLLVGLAILGAFLAGYSTAESDTHQFLHIFCYVVLTAFTIYIIIDLELPRIGLIRVNSFDQILINVRDGM